MRKRHGIVLCAVYLILGIAASAHLPAGSLEIAAALVFAVAAGVFAAGGFRREFIFLIFLPLGMVVSLWQWKEPDERVSLFT